MLKLLALALLVALVASEAPLLHLDNPNIIPGSYIVMLKDGMSALDRDAHISELQEHIRLTNAEDSDVSFRYHMGNDFVGFAAHLNKEVLQHQLNHSNVKYIEADQVMSINYIQEPRAPAALTQTGATWGISRVSRRDLPAGTTYAYNTLAGTGVDVYVIDTGILTTHNDFGGRATAVYNAITGESGQDLNGHGTHCAGTIAGTTYGVAKLAQLKAVKVLSASGSGSNTGVIAGVNYVSNNKVASRKSVASMSLGGGATTALDQAVQTSANGGVVYSLAAGNDNANACNYSPARATSTSSLTVGATTNTDARSSFSNFGTCVHIFAPGSSITSDWIGSNSATNTISGTSMATPHVAGGAALYWSTSLGSTSAQVRSNLVSVGTPNKVTSPGTGSANVLLFTNPV